MAALAFLVKYWRDIIIGILILSLVGAALYIRSVFIERDSLKQEKAVLSAQLQYAEKMQQMQEKIADAISQIKIRSNVNVSRIESEPAPKFVDARPLPFIPGGVPVAQRLYSSATAPRGADAAAAPGGPVPPGEPPGAVLPH
jgi:hypothetical protein